MLTEIPVVFPSGGGTMLAGRIVRNTADLTVRQIGVVVTGSWLTVKEQMALSYARRLAALGYTAFAFDFAGWGESGGEPRQAEIPARKIEDIIAAVDYLAVGSLVFGDRIAIMSNCASAQYALRALARGANAAAFASIAGWYHDAATIAQFYDGQEGVARRMALAAADVEAYLQSQPRTLAPAYAPGDERAGMHFHLDYYSNPSRGLIPAWKNEMALMSWAHWLTFDGMAAAVAVATPTLMVHGDGCALPENAKRVYAQLAGPKHLEWRSGQQVDFYDQPECVDPAVAAIDAWFKVHLSP